jgi:hypothetical protein
MLHGMGYAEDRQEKGVGGSGVADEEEKVQGDGLGYLDGSRLPEGEKDVGGVDKRSGDLPVEVELGGLLPVISRQGKART